MSEISVGRRLALCAIALVAAAYLVRPQVSSALVVRGDEMAARANVLRAMELYRRALWFDAGNRVAVDRYAFTAMMMHDPHSMRAAIVLVANSLSVAPQDRTLLFDRAMCERSLRMPAAAERDFADLGLRARDPQAYVFAGFSALQLGAPKRAKRWWRFALAIDRSYIPALHALAKRGA